MKIDIQEIVNNKVKAMEESGVIQKTIEDTIEKSVLGAIDNALDGYRLKREIEDKIKKEVSSIVSDIGFTAYNSFIVEKVKSITEGFCRADIAEKIQKTFDNMLMMKKENIKLSEIFEMYREWVCKEVEDPDKYSYERFHVKFEKHEIHDWYDIELAKEKPESKYGCSYGDDVIKFTLHQSSSNKGEGWIGNTYLDGVNIKEKYKFGSCTDVELLLVNLTLNQTTIIIDVEDEDDIDNSYDIDI